MPPGRAFIAVQAPDAHCWYCEPMQLNMPSEVQAPDLAEEEPLPPSEPVELPEFEPPPLPPPVGERVADGAGLVAEVAETVVDADVSAVVVAAADDDEEEEDEESVAVGAVMDPVSDSAGADPVADPAFSEAEVAVGTGMGLT